MGKFEDPFPPESLKDRGQLNEAEYQAWRVYERFRFEELSSEHPMSSWSSEKIERFNQLRLEYGNSGYNFDDHKHLGLGWNLNCFAIKSIDVVGMINTLSRNFQYELVEIDHSSFNHVNQFSPKSFDWRKNGGYLLVMQPAGGTIFAETNLLGSCLGGSYRKCLESIHCSWDLISEQFGDVTLFWSSGSGANGALAWRKGKLTRGFSSGQDYKISGFGIPEDFEISSSVAHDGSDYLSEEDIWTMAAYEKANSNYIRPLQPGEAAYCWLVDI